MDKGENGRRFAEWTETLGADVEATWLLITDESIGAPGRRLLAGALSYLLTQLDLIPDHEQAGSVDDALVLRVAGGLAVEHAAKAGVKQAAHLGRLSNEDESVKQFLGDTLYAKLRRYVVDLADKNVRGRTTDQILGDARARTDMRRELDIAVKKLRPALADDAAAADALEVAVKSYLKMKLGG
jgi:uncharacterized membrane protein YkvA (DUF1232 family)